MGPGTKQLIWDMFHAKVVGRRDRVELSREGM